MKKSTRYMLIGIGIVTWMVLSASSVFAQNYSGIISVDTKLAEVDSNTATGVELYPDVSLTPAVQDGSKILYEPVTRPRTVDPIISVESSNYTLGEKDVIEIVVSRHPEVSGEYIINNEGKIQYEFVGDVVLAGLKKDEVKDLLTKLLSEYIITPEVIVQIIGFNSKIVYVLGEVRKPGKILLYGDTITVREALIQAGLPLDTAKTSKSRLIVPSDTGKSEKRIVNVHKLLYEGDLRENYIMRPGDTLYVPPTGLAKTLRIIQPITRPVNSWTATGRRIYTGF